MKKRKELCHILLCHFITHLTALLSWLYSTNIYACRNFIIIISVFFLFKEKCWCCRVSVLFISCSFVRLNAIFIEITKSRSWCCRWWVACNKSLTFFYFFFLFFFLTLWIGKAFIFIRIICNVKESRRKMRTEKINYFDYACVGLKMKYWQVNISRLGNLEI